MKTITLYPEWAWAVCHLGKNIENRTWLPNLKCGDKLAIHSGSRRRRRAFDKMIDTAIRAGYSRDKIDSLLSIFPIKTKSIVAIVVYQGTENSDSEWSVSGNNHWKIDLFKKIEDGAIINGRLKLWESPSVN